MSYSTCLKCREMVRGYEKYCDECAKTHAQDATFWKRDGSYDVLCAEEKTQNEIEIDRATVAMREGLK